MTRFIFILAMIVAGSALAQEVPPDVKLFRIAGTYNVCCMTPSDTDLATLCYSRTDLEPISSLGCILVPNGDTKYCKLLTVARTTFNDAEIRCFVSDRDDNISEMSPNKGDIDFTPPGRAKVVSP